ncbi:MAG TPA: hypothetical protein VEK08_08325 [Planctomycetota bacterium]|nr:hypothetical protein [Planctomycetota bacterium]
MSSVLTPQSEKSHQALNETLLSFGRYRKQWELLHGVSKLIVVGPGLLLAWFILDALFLIPAWPLLISFTMIVLLSMWATIAWVVKPQLRRIDIDREAYVIESLHGKLDNQIIGSLQLGREVALAGNAAALGYSPHFVSELLLKTARMLDSLHVRQLLDLSRARRAMLGAAVVLALSSGCVLFASDAVRQRRDRLMDAYTLFLDTLFPVQIKVSPGSVAVIRGKSIRLEVEVVGARRNEVRLYRTKAGSPDSHADILPLSSDKAVVVIENAQDSFSYYFEYGNRRSELYKIQVGDLPDIKTINYELSFPAYTGQPSRTMTGRIPKLRGLSGTNVLVSFAATTDLHPDLSYVEWQDGSRQTIQFSGRFGHFGFTLSRQDRGTIYLTSALARPPHEKEWRMPQPVSFEVDVQRDEVPSVQILLKNKKLTMFAEQAAVFGFEWLAEDDFGVAEVSMEYRIETIDELLGRKPRQDSQTRLIEPARERVKGKFLDMFKTLSPPLEPGDKITIALTAKDNNTETGPGGSRSAPIEIVIVRPDLGAFVEQQFKFGSLSPMGEMVKVKRSTDLLVDPQKTVRTESVQKIEKKEIKTHARQESWPSGSEDATGDYFRLLSGEK